MVGLISLSCESLGVDREKLQALADNLALHTVAAKPLYLTRDSVPDTVLSKERDILTTQVRIDPKSSFHSKQISVTILTHFLCSFIINVHSALISIGRNFW